MKTSEVDEFFASVSGLRRPTELRRLLLALPADSSALYDLTFHAAFASRLFAILKREGSALQGYERMQQSLSDSVGLIRGLLESLEAEHRLELGLVATASEQSSFGGLVEDLSTVKAWMLERTHR